MGPTLSSFNIIEVSIFLITILVDYWLFVQPMFDWLSYVAPGDQLSWVELATSEIPRL